MAFCKRARRRSAVHSGNDNLVHNFPDQTPVHETLRSLTLSVC